MIVPVLEAGAVILRPLGAGDAEAIVTQIGDREVSRWLTMVPHPYTRADADWFLTEFLGDPANALHWAIDDGTGLIGAIGLKPDLGYWLARSYHGRGIMTAAARVVVDWHFARSDETLLSGYHLGNGRSRAVLTRLGFVPTRIERDVPRASGAPVDIQRLELSRAGWAAAQTA